MSTATTKKITVSQIRKAIRTEASLSPEQREDLLIELNELNGNVIYDAAKFEGLCYFNRLPGAGTVIGSLAD